MSTFNGKIQEIPGISVDEFVNVDEKCYFLSHCHTDHMEGLSTLQTEAPFYTTAISALFLQSKFPDLKDNIKILEFGVATSIDLQHNEDSVQNFIVTALSAGHCPGSCMLFFQTEGFDVLYTGDFRMSMKNLSQVKLLDTIGSHANVIIYLDSTFMKTSFLNFPSQTESVVKIVELVDSHLKGNENNTGDYFLSLIFIYNLTINVHFSLVNLRVPARYGYEYLLMELSTRLSEKTFVHETNVRNQYLRISGLDSCIATNSAKARIFLIPTYLTSPVKTEKKEFVLNLQLSAMFWANWKHGSFVEKISRNSFRVCYATHNSFSEIKSFLTYLKPKKVHLNVLPDGVERAEMFRQLALIQKQYSNDESIREDNDGKIPTSSKKYSFKRIKSLSSRSATSVDKKQKHS